MAIGTSKQSTGNSIQAGSDGSKTDSIRGNDDQDGLNVDRDLSFGIRDDTTRNEKNSSNAKEFVIDEPPTKRKRGRPPKGTGNTPQNTGDKRKDKASVKLDKVELTPDTVQKFSAFYLFINNTIASAQKAPDFLIGIQEAQAIGEPLSEILNDMGLLGVGLDTPYIRLAMVVAGVYGGRVMIRVQMNKEKQRQKTNAESVQPATVDDFVSANAPSMKFDEDI